MASPTHPRITAVQKRLGSDMATWRKFRRLTVDQLADRAGISARTLVNVENGRGASLENVLRIARALGVLDQLAESLDPYATEAGQLRADEALPQRVRPSKDRP